MRLKRYILSINLVKNSFIINLLYIIFLFFKYALQSRFKIIFPIKLKNKKKSDTLVILGSGNTINSLTNQQSRELKKFDIAGLSYSIFSSIKHNFYFFENPNIDEKEALNEFKLKVIPYIENQFNRKNVENLIWKNPENRFFNKYIDYKNYRKIIVCHILADNKNTIIKILNFIEYFKLNKFFLIQKRGSLFSLIVFAKLMGYKRVIFSGVDLNNNKYFIDDEKFSNLNLISPSLLDLSNRQSKYINTLSKNTHYTNDPVTGIPISEILNDMFEHYKEMSFLVSSKNSELIKYIPLWKP